MSDPITTDDLVTGRAAEQLGEGVIPTAAILIVATISENGPGLRYLIGHGTPQFLAIGMLRSATNHYEAEDLHGWEDEDD